MDKPDVDFIEGLSPAISIDQKSASRNPRSTVGTITEVYDYLRLLFARIGVPHCPECGAQITRQTPQQIVDRILELPEGTRFQVLAPVVRGRKGTYETLLTDLAAQGYARARIDGEVHELTDKVDLARYEQHTIEVVVDRLVVRDGLERRLTDSLETALRLADGVAEVQLVRRDGEAVGGAEDGEADDTLTFSQHLACPNGHGSFEELAPRNFSFNSPYGACETCDGLGTRFEVDPELIVPNRDLSLADGAISPWASASSQYFKRLVESVAEELGADARRAVGQAHEEAAAGVPARHRRRQGAGPVQEPLRPGPLLHRQLRGRRPVPAAPPLRVGERQRPRADRGLHARGAVPGLRGRPARARCRCRSPSTATRSPRSATCRSARRPRRWPASSSPSAIGSSPSGS